MVDTLVKPIRVYAVEEQEIYRQLYQSALIAEDPIELVKVSSQSDMNDVRNSVEELHPDVLLLSTKKVNPTLGKELEQLRLAHPSLAIVLLLIFYDPQDIRPLRRLALTGGGMALFLKQSLDFTDQLYSIILAVNQGQVILDPRLTNLLLTDRVESPFLKQLTPRELEILNLLADGNTNGQIAETLFIDLKTVEHHINSMYSELRSMGDVSQKHLRVSAARLYLEATGKLSGSKIPGTEFAYSFRT